MTNTISINAESHPITQKLLNEEMTLTELLSNPDAFYEGKAIYNTHAEAQCRGFEAEHITTVALQIKRYNEQNGTRYNSYTDRRLFGKEVGIPDDRCYRMTSFEHIISHLIKAYRNPEEEAIFSRMSELCISKIKGHEKEVLEKIIQQSQIREKWHAKVAEFQRGKTKQEITGNLEWVDPRKGKTAAEIYGEDHVHPRLGKHLIDKNPEYVNPSKGKTFKELTGNPDYVHPNKGKTKKEITGNPDFVNPSKGKTGKEIYGENWISPNLGKVRYTDGVREIVLDPGIEPPEGFVQGSSRKGKTIQEITGNQNYVSPKLGISNTSCKSTIWYNNGITNIRIKEGDTPPEGFVKGHFSAKKPHKPSNWVNPNKGKTMQEIKNDFTYVHPNLGRPNLAAKGLKCYNNGIINKRYIPGTEPEGFVLGQLSRKEMEEAKQLQ